jgi:hypothetical protein
MKNSIVTEGTQALMKKQCEDVRCIDKVALGVMERLKVELSIPVYFVTHLDVFNFELDESYCLYVVGNEVHQNFDRKFLEDKNCKAIIKPYPYIPDYSPVTVQSCEIDGKYFIKTGNEDERILNFPLGHSVSFKEKNLEKSIQLGFCGQASGIRSQITNCVSWRDITTIETYQGFGIDRGSEKYSEFMAKCNVALVPMGHSPETYRLFEAALAGCALFGTPLPFTEYYSECPTSSIPWQYFNEHNSDLILSFFATSVLKNQKRLQHESKLWARKWTDVDFLAKKAINHINLHG